MGTCRNQEMRDCCSAFLNWVSFRQHKLRVYQEKAPSRFFLRVMNRKHQGNSWFPETVHPCWPTVSALFLPPSSSPVRPEDRRYSPSLARTRERGKTTT